MALVFVLCLCLCIRSIPRVGSTAAAAEFSDVRKALDPGGKRTREDRHRRALPKKNKKMTGDKVAAKEARGNFSSSARQNRRLLRSGGAAAGSGRRGEGESTARRTKDEEAPTTKQESTMPSTAIPMRQRRLPGGMSHLSPNEVGILAAMIFLLLVICCCCWGPLKDLLLLFCCFEICCDGPGEFC